MDYLNAISQVGVPAVVLLIILLRLDKTMIKLADNVVLLSKIVSHCPNNDYPEVL